MSTDTLDTLLPEAMRRFVNQRVQEGAYADTGEYVRDLVRRDQEAQAAKRLRELIQEGLASGPASPLTDTDITSVRARIAARAR